jgi:hypothetical protein
MIELLHLFVMVSAGSLAIGFGVMALFGVGGPFERHFDKGMMIGAVVVAVGAVVAMCLALLLLVSSI